jgi:multiple sugar transport system substrate-binding protein
MNVNRYVLPAVLTIALCVTPSLAGPADPPPVTIRVIGDPVSAVDGLSSLARDFSDESGIAVVVEKAGFKDALEKATNDLNSKGGAYDIVLQEGTPLGEFADNNSIFTIDELEKISGKKADFESDLFPKAWHELSWYRGTRYGYPVVANTMYVIYRQDMIGDPAEKTAFRKRYGYELGAPQDWKQYRDLAEFFTRPDKGFYGTLLQGKRHPAVRFEWLNFAYSFGGGVMERQDAWQDGPIIINSPDTIEATDYYNSLKKFAPPGTANFTWDDAGGQMRNGHIFMCIMWSDAALHVEDPTISTVAGKVGFAALPAGKAGRIAQVAGASYLVSRYSRHPKEAFQFELWMEKLPNQIKLELSKAASARTSVYEDRRVKELPNASAHAYSLNVAKRMVETAVDAASVSAIVQTAVNDVLSDRKTSKQAMDWAASEIHASLGNKAALTYPASN